MQEWVYDSSRNLKPSERNAEGQTTKEQFVQWVEDATSFGTLKNSKEIALNAMSKPTKTMPMNNLSNGQSKGNALTYSTEAGRMMAKRDNKDNDVTVQ